MGDAFIFLGNREFLQQHLAELTPDQGQTLTKADGQVLAFAAKQYENEDDDDVRILRMCVDVINGKPLPKSA